MSDLRDTRRGVAHPTHRYGVRGYRPSMRALRWYGPGTQITIAGFELRSPLIYVDTTPGSECLNGDASPEPGRLDPTLVVDHEAIADWSGPRTYPQSFAELTPGLRAGFLEYLSRRSDGPRGWMALHVKAIERRVLVEWPSTTPSEEERDAVVSRLRLIERASAADPGLRAHARELADIADDRSASINLPPPPLVKTSPALALGLARHAHQGLALSPRWASTWALAETADQSFPARIHAPAEFRELIELEYARKASTVQPIPRQGSLEVHYTPLNETLGRDVRIVRSDLPAIDLRLPIELEDLLVAAAAALQPYAEARARDRGRQRTLLSVALLPRQLALEAASPELEGLLERLRSYDLREPTVVPTREAFPEVLPAAYSSVGIPQTAGLFGLLEYFGIGVEPDPRFVGGPLRGEGTVALFGLSKSSRSAPGANYLAASLLLHLSAMLAIADGVVDPDERRHLETHLEQRWELTEDERLRLRAHLEWLLQGQPRLVDALDRLREVGRPEREQIGHMLISLAAADGHVAPSEHDLLARLFERLGLGDRRLDQLLRTVDPRATASLRAVSESRSSQKARAERGGAGDTARFDVLFDALFPDDEPQQEGPDDEVLT